MMLPSRTSKRALVLTTAWAVIMSLILLGRHVNAEPSRPGQMEVESVAPATPLLAYQGRLLDPATGAPRPNGMYHMIFSLYDVDSGGTALWSETKNISITNGLFSALLGDTTPFDLAHFDGRALWLGVTVGADPEAAPRQVLAYAPYALHAKNAETLGGQSPAAFAAAAHTHSAADITSGMLATDRYSAYADLVAESKIGSGAAQVAVGDHNHDGRYYTESEANGRFVNSAGDSMSGALTVPRLLYPTPHTHYFIIGSEGFVPGSNVAYTNTYGNGGAYIASGSGALVAPVHLPQGAVVTAFKVFFYDTSGANMTVYLDRQFMTGGAFGDMATISSAGVSGYDSRSTTAITNPTVDNTAASYLVYAYSDAWDSNLRIKGALITYTIQEAP